MISSMSKKEQILDLLLVTQARGGRAYSRLLRYGMTNEAAAVRARNKRVLNAIERLWVDIAQDWNGTATTRVRDLKAMNANIKRSVTGLRNRVRRAQKTARILSLLDDVIALAVGL